MIYFIEDAQTHNSGVSETVDIATYATCTVITVRTDSNARLSQYSRLLHGASHRHPPAEYS